MGIGTTQTAVAVDGTPAGIPLAGTDDIIAKVAPAGHVWEVGGVASTTITEVVVVPPGGVGSIAVIPISSADADPCPGTRHNIVPEGKLSAAA